MEEHPLYLLQEVHSRVFLGIFTDRSCLRAEAKAKKELMEKAKGKGPLNIGTQGIKKSGKK